MRFMQNAGGFHLLRCISAFDTFYEAENYHQEYYRNNSLAPYCQIVIDPKLRKLHKEFSALLKSSSINA